MARRARALQPIVAEALRAPPRDPGFYTLLAANLGTSVIPWALLYQQAATVHKGLGPAHLSAARIETLVGVVVCQAITSALLIAAGATLSARGALHSVAEIETAFTVTLGGAFGRVVFVLGLTGSALTATIVVCLTLAWSVGEAFGVGSSLDHSPAQAPWFYGAMAAMLAGGGALVASGANLVSLSIAAGVANAVLLPVVLGFLYLPRPHGAARAAAPARRLRGGDRFRVPDGGGRRRRLGDRRVAVSKARRIDALRASPRSCRERAGATGAGAPGAERA